MLGIVVIIGSILVSALVPFDKLGGFIGPAFHEGGWGMRPIMFALLVSLWLTIDRVVVLMKASFDAGGFIPKLRALLNAGDIAGAIQLCKTIDKPATRIIGVGFGKSGEGEDKVLAAIDEVAYSELPQIEKRTGYLALLGNVATLMGLLGTIIGLIKSFAGVAGKETAEKATLLAAGISEAMNCTAFGLLVGISALFAFSVLNGKTQAIIDEINYLTIRAFRIWKKSVSKGKAPHFSAKTIAAPSSHLMGHVGLLSGTGHGHKKRSTFASLQLTPLIDMFIVMVIFLLMSFSATGEILFVSKDIKLPFASKVEKLDQSHVVAISYPQNDPLGGVVTLDGSEVSTAKDLLGDEVDWKIAKLVSQLDIMKENWKQTNRDKEFPGELIIQSDQNVDFKIIKKIIYSAGVSGYVNVHFAVTEKLKGGGAGE